MRHNTRLVIGTVLMTALLLAPISAAGSAPDIGLDDRQDEPPCPVSDRVHDVNGTDVPCPDPVEDGASCRSFGIFVVERDGTGGVVGSAVLDASESHAWTAPVPGPVPHYPAADPRPTMPPTPKDPQAHADAEQAGVSYTNTALGVSVEASEVFSRCDVAALDTNEGLHTEAYGRAGVSDLKITLPGVSIGAEVLDFEDHAYGVPLQTYAFEACDVVEVSITPGPTVAHCPGKNTGIGVGPATVEIHDSWGPTNNDAGQTLYGGAALHVSASSGAQTVDIYVGFVGVAVTGGEPLDSFWAPGECNPPQFECLA